MTSVLDIPGNFDGWMRLAFPWDEDGSLDWERKRAAWAAGGAGLDWAPWIAGFAPGLRPEGAGYRGLFAAFGAGALANGVGGA